MRKERENLKQSCIVSNDESGVFGHVGDFAVRAYRNLCENCTFVINVFRGIYNTCRVRSCMRRVDLWVEIDRAGLRAIPIVCLISFMVGVIIAFVGHMQLELFGAEIYVAALVAISMVRIIGAIMTGIIMAGRTGASYAAEIGSMRANDEIDALKTMGISPMEFLVLPRVFALTITMPILTMWSDIMGMLGGGFVGVAMLGIPMQKYYELSVDAISLNNFLVGIFHGFVFGIVIAVCGCYYGINCGRNADSVGVSTTKAVVSAIIWMIVMTGIITVICQELEI